MKKDSTRATAHTAARIANLVASPETGKEHRAMIARALGSAVTTLVSFGGRASAELARGVFLAILRARRANALNPTALLKCGTDYWEWEARERLAMLAAEAANNPGLHIVHYSRRHAGVTDIRVESDDARRTCGIRRGDTIYIEGTLHHGRDLRPGDIVATYWIEGGKPGWQTLIGRVEERGGRIVAVNDEGTFNPAGECARRVVSVERPVGHERAWLIEAEEVAGGEVIPADDDGERQEEIARLRDELQDLEALPENEAVRFQLLRDIERLERERDEWGGFDLIDDEKGGA